MAPKSLPEGLIQITLRVPPSVVDYFEAAAVVAMRENPGRIVTRADLMRQVLTAHVEQGGAPDAIRRERRKPSAR